MKKTKVGQGRGHGQRLLRVEQLERRAMLAGNVAVSVSGGNLIIRGDNADNGVLVQQIDADSYAVTGFSVDGSATTMTRSGSSTSGGGSNGTVIANGVTADVNIDLRGGDDVLGVGNDVDALVDLAAGFGFGFGDASASASLEGVVSVHDDLIIRTGDGDDFIGIIAEVDDVADINTGRHDDSLGIVDSSIGNDLIILTNSGEDGVFVGQGTQELGTTVGDNLIVNTGSDDDAVLLSDFDVEGTVVVVTGSGDDADVELRGFFVGGNVVVDTGSGNDGTFGDESPVTVADATIEDNLTIVTGSGEDVVLVDNVGVGKNLVINSGAHTDSVDVLNTDVGRDAVIVLGANTSGPQEFEFLLVSGLDVVRNAVIDAGSGSDIVIVEESNVDGKLTVLMGSGSDEFLHVCNTTAGSARFDGGSGSNDTLEWEPLPGFVQVNFDFVFLCDEGEVEEEEEGLV